ncbi:MAG: 2-oxoisovalerate dehydrogenase [Saprospiraceae bacterium]|nr:2-oxoisovalerate dehydrogenase [Saprospiraceae bacterium]
MQEVIFVINESIDLWLHTKLRLVYIYRSRRLQTLKENIIDAVSCHFDDNTKRIVRMHFVKDEVLTA